MPTWKTKVPGKGIKKRVTNKVRDAAVRRLKKVELFKAQFGGSKYESIVNAIGKTDADKLIAGLGPKRTDHLVRFAGLPLIEESISQHGVDALIKVARKSNMGNLGGGED